MTVAYQFKPYERPVIPGSPYNPEHPTWRMWAYGAIGILAGLTGGLGTEYGGVLAYGRMEHNRG